MSTHTMPCATLAALAPHLPQEDPVSLPVVTGTARLLGDPRSGKTRTGGLWANAVVKFSAWRKTDAGWEEGDGVDQARRLLTLAKGDDVGIEGKATLAMWKDQPQLKVTVEELSRPVKSGKDAAQSDVRPSVRRAA